MFLLKKNSFELESSSARVTADEAAAIATVEDVIAAANEEAQSIVAKAGDAYEAEKKRGYEDGLAEGKEEILLQKMAMLDETIAYMEGVEGKIVDLVMKALHKCVTEIGDREMVFQIVHKAMQALVRTQREITVRVSPAMVPVIKERVHELQEQFPTLTLIHVAEEAQLDDTSCVVETEAGMVEASINGQLEAIRKSIERHFQH